MTAERLPAFTPTEEYRYFRVTVMANKWDSDEGKWPVTVHAIGALSARELAVEKVRDEYPDACAVHVEELGDPLYHDECGTRWDQHDNRFFGAKLPFGCLPELELRRRGGDR